MRRWNALDAKFQVEFKAFLSRRNIHSNTDESLYQSVREILLDVQKNGFAAIAKLTHKLDGWQPKQFEDLCFNPADFKQAFLSLPKKEQQALKQASAQIIEYHQKQKLAAFDYQDEFGNHLGQIIRPIEKVGVYVPGGLAAYPSSVLMNALPAQVAGVKNITMVVPTPKGLVNQQVLACAHLAGIQKAYRIGGAVAVAALAFGVNETVNGKTNPLIEPVDKIVGPGNQYVAEAKRQVFGRVGIDMIAGPSELAIVCDESANPKWVCLDLFAQAEHDEQASSILISTSAPFLDAVEAEIAKQLPKQPRKNIIQKSLENQGALIEAPDLNSAIELANQIAPEHLELACHNAAEQVQKIKNAGAIFVGNYSAEVYGDYCAGPSHVLPTSGSARFSSPLGVYDFLKRMSVIACTKAGSQKLAAISSQIAASEGLYAHRDSALARTEVDSSTK